MTIYLEPASLPGDAEPIRTKDTGRKLALKGELGLYFRDRQTGFDHLLTWQALEEMLHKHRPGKAADVQGAA